MAETLSRDVPIEPEQTALLFIDVQNFGTARDACDLGYLVTLVPDACATHSQERHDNTLRAIKGYCRQRSTEALLAELDGGPKEDPATRAGLPGFHQEG